VYVPVVLVVLGLFLFALATLLVAARRIDLTTARPFKQVKRGRGERKVSK
jgi:hypothetical protein